MAKRPSEDVIFCCNVAYYSNKTGKFENKISNRIYSFSHNDKWDDVLGDLLEEVDESTLGKADTVEVCVSSKKDGSEVFYPDYNERIEVIKQFDKTLKYVTFKITKFDTQCKDCEGTESSTSTKDINQNVPNAYDRLMCGTQYIKKQPKLKADDGVRFTGKLTVSNRSVSKRSVTDILRHFTCHIKIINSARGR